VNSVQTAASASSNFSKKETLEIPHCYVELCSEIVSSASHVLALPDLRNETFDWDLSSINSTDYALFNNAYNASPQNFMAEVQLMTYSPMASASARIPWSSAFNFRSLWTRPSLNTGAQVTANRMASILNSYPRMMLNDNALPPFIHPQWVLASGSEPSLEPLANCMSLLGSLGTNVRGNTSLFWRNVRMECDRLPSTHHKLNKLGLVAAAQALLVYMLIRVAEGETEYNNHDAALLGTTTILLEDLKNTLQYQPLELVNQGKSWSNWIFEESRQRMGVIFRIVNMLVCVEPATACGIQPGLILAPLPARKQLWEAGDEEQWVQECGRKEVNGGFGLAMNGDLVTLDEHQKKLLSIQSMEPWTSSKSKENWEEWCSGMDGFGALIMLAASLPM
jgi:hypothetical protein